MFDERAFTAQFEASDVDEMIHLLDRPSLEEEQALRAHLGDALFQRLHGLSLRYQIQRERERRPRGNVVVIPGFLGSELALSAQVSSTQERLWLNLPRIMDGVLKRLRLADNGLHGTDMADDVYARGLVKRQYGELLLTLSRHWNVRAFAYDWRKDIEQTTGSLLAQINSWFGVDAPVHIVAHGMGCLIARSFIRDQKTRWLSMKSDDARSSLGGRLLMLGGTNHGSFMALRALTGTAELVQHLALIDRHHDFSDILKVIHSFVSVYQMLPSPAVDRTLAPLFDPETYGELHVSGHHLRRARETQRRIAESIDVERMVQVVGHGFRTTTGITNIDRISQGDGYRVSAQGDGNVALSLARLRDPDGKLVDIPTFFLRSDHAGLASSPVILATIDELLETGTCVGLDRVPPDDPEEFGAPAIPTCVLDAESPEIHSLIQTKTAAKHLHLRGASTAIIKVTAEERVLSDSLIRGLVVAEVTPPKQTKKVLAIKAPTIELGLICGKIASIDCDRYRSARGDHPIDAIAVGHYVGVKPQGQERELDEAISRAHLRKLGIGKGRVEESDLLLTQYSERGIIRGELGQPFFLEDPRAERPGSRLIVIAGMGIPGRFGAPELFVLVRELVWSVGRLGKRHLSAAHIGTKNGNLSVEDTISSWVRGIKAAFTGADETEQRHLVKISFIVNDPRRIARYEDAILTEQRRMKDRDRLEIDYERLKPDQLEAIRREGLERERQEFQALQETKFSSRQSALSTPTRVTLGLDRKIFRYGAITEDASISERAVPIDPDLVEQANKELAAEFDPDMQLERGRFLERLIIPSELRELMASDAPLVMMLDSAAARIHWEMVATSDPVRSIDKSEASPPATGGTFGPFEFASYFLGTSRGFTRQLRTAFAPPPEPPPPPRRILRVLVVADSAEDARLPGAEAEGIEVADLFERFNTTYSSASKNHVEVVRLLGPREATRTNVLRELMIRSYDVLHFAGHCVYDEAEPKESGWVFSNGQRIAANELTRIDRVPKFIFSNACESGITPDRSDQRSAALAPSFAESFFERGVSNFVCTAWPVNDGAARLFALNLYAQLLGLRRVEDGHDRYGTAEPVAMVDAMREARLAIAPLDEGIRTWGAYQHYGNPYFRFFAATSADDEPATSVVVEKERLTVAKCPTAKPRRQSAKQR